MPKLNPPGEDQECEDAGLNDLQNLRQNQELAAVDAVGDDSAQRTEDKSGSKLTKADQPEIKGRVRQLPHEPILDHLLDVFTSVARDVTSDEQTKIAVA